MPFWTSTRWEVQLHGDGGADHALTIELHELASALDHEPDRQTITVTAPAGLMLQTQSVSCSEVELRKGDSWSYDQALGRVTVNLKALAAARALDQVNVCLKMVERGAVTVEGPYRCYWLGFKERLGGGGETDIRLPHPTNPLEKLWAAFLSILGVRPYETHVFSAPGSIGRQQQSSQPDAVSLVGERSGRVGGKLPSGHLLIFRRSGTLPLRPLIGTFVIGGLASLLAGLLVNSIWTTGLWGLWPG